jgi:stage III sporulation protein AB
MWYGRLKSLRLAERSRALADLLEMARVLEVKIRVGGFALPDALDECAHKFTDTWVGEYAQDLSARYQARQVSQELWLESLRSLKKVDEVTALLEEDKQDIALFGDGLSGSDLKAITENFGFFYTRLEQRIQRSEEDKKIKGRLYRTIGSLAGLAIAIVIA